MEFNLVTEPWVPVVTTDGTVKEVSFQDAFAHAAEFKEFGDPSPVVNYALLRLMLAVLYHVLGQPDLNNWRQLWEGREFGREITAYLEGNAASFNLFDRRKPFFQNNTVQFEERYRQPVAKLTFADASGNNPTLFDHNAEADPRRYTPGEAARHLVAYQYFTPSAGNSLTGYTKDAPLARPYVVVVLGDNLFETLMLNYAPIPQDRVPPGQRQDMPIWERHRWEPEYDCVPAGILEYLTWPSRVVQLLPEREDGRTFVRYCYVAQGRHIADNLIREPATGFSPRAARAGQQELTFWRFGENRAVWRDSEAILRSVHVEGYLPPIPLRWLAEIAGRGWVKGRQSYPIEIVGLCTETGQPKVLFWRRERFALPLAYLDPDYGPNLVGSLATALGLAERVAREAIYPAVATFARLVIAPESDDPQKPQPDKKDVNNLINTLGVEREYWAALDGPFRKLLAQLPEHGDAAVGEWAVTLRDAATRAFAQATADAESAKTLKAATVARGRLMAALYGYDYQDQQTGERKRHQGVLEGYLT